MFFEENEDTYSAEMQKYLSRLSVLQREVLRLISIGFDPNEILTELHINKKQYEDCYNAIHAYRNTSILMEGIGGMWNGKTKKTSVHNGTVHKKR